MKVLGTFLLLAALLAALGAVQSAAEKRQPRQSRISRRLLQVLSDPEASSSEDNTLTVVAAPKENDETKPTEEESVPVPAEPETDEVKPRNPCLDKSCGAGRICEADDAGVPQCICIPECPQEVDPRRKVCSNHNETWNSDCSVYQARCRCKDNLPSCRNEEDRHVHIEYFGECREMPQCTEADMSDFPRRMRDWLFNVMRDMADRAELSPHYSEMHREAENNLTRRWANAAIWKWCDLDGHPHDRTVSRHELFPIRAPLMALEHCIAPFLDKCDSNDDHHITLQEWGTCLELDQSEINEKCEDVGAAEA